MQHTQIKIKQTLENKTTKIKSPLPSTNPMIHKIRTSFFQSRK
jgi:hypothetical protein